jgi:hypothetical protein
LRPDKPERRVRSNAAAIKSGAKKALRKLMEPLAGFACDCGLSVNEVVLLLEEGAVRNAAHRQHQKKRRINVSGIAAVTGVSRAKASLILTQDNSGVARLHDRYLSPANRILEAWHCDPRFLTAQREPAELKLFGRRGLTFESLVIQYGRGIPVRAILDELTSMGAIEVRVSQGIQAKTLVAVDRRITPQMIRALSGGLTDLLSAVSQGTQPRRNKRPEKREATRRNFTRAG